LLQSLTGNTDRVGIVPDEVMGDIQPHIEDCILQIVWAHVGRLFRMSNCLIRSPINCKREAKITVCGSNVRGDSDPIQE
jgi:hypothetical protein